MPTRRQPLLLSTLFCAAAVLTAGCSPRKIPPMTVSDLMEDRVVLDGVLLRCNEHPQAVRENNDCINARIASERLESERHDPALDAKRLEDFERSREQLRSQQDRQRQEQEAKTKVDAYHLPLVPVDPVPPPKSQSPIVGQTSPQ